jgi:hypothetical protein
MAELADEDTSELIRVNQSKSKEAAVLLSKLEVCTCLQLSFYRLTDDSNTSITFYSVGDRPFLTILLLTMSTPSK